MAPVPTKPPCHSGKFLKQLSILNPFGQFPRNKEANNYKTERPSNQATKQPTSQPTNQHQPTSTTHPPNQRTKKQTDWTLVFRRSTSRPLCAWCVSAARLKKPRRGGVHCCEPAGAPPFWGFLGCVCLIGTPCWSRNPKIWGVFVCRNPLFWVGQAISSMLVGGGSSSVPDSNIWAFFMGVGFSKGKPAENPRERSDRMLRVNQKGVPCLK